MAARRLVVTRPAAQAAAWVQALREAGCDAVALPLIDILPARDAASVEAAWRALPQAALAMFVSANAVERFFAARPEPPADALHPSWPPGVLAGSTGAGTAAALAQAGVPPAQVVSPAAGDRAESESLWRQLEGRPWQGRRVLVLRGEDGRDWLAERLRDAGAEVEFVTVYRRAVPVLDGPGRAVLAQALADPAAHAWLFSSSQAVAHLGALAPHAGWGGACALVTHPRIAQAAREAGFGRVAEVEGTVNGVAQGWARLQSAAP